MSTALALLLAILLDAVFGEPKWLWSRAPHPAVLMGRLIAGAEARFNKGTNRRRNGILVVVGLSVALGVLAMIAAQIPLLDILLAAILLAHRSLTQHVRAVADALQNSLLAGRRAVGMIVGRDTADMDKSAVGRAAIESAAENFSDGVIAPAFWFLIAGLPGIVIYKFVNTCDSMIGYRTERYEQFGWAAAKLDDILNWIPARLTALLLRPRGAKWSDIASDARKHRSPNAGWPEAAMSRSLDIAVSGPRSYHGEMKAFPWVNPEGRRIVTPFDIEQAVARLWTALGAICVGLAILALLAGLCS